jgi:integrase
MSDAAGAAVGLSAMGVAGYDGERLLVAVGGVLPGWRVSCKQRAGRLGACRLLVEVLDGLPGVALQDRWEAFEERVWPAWAAGRGRPAHHHWSYGIWTVVMARAVRPGWPVLNTFAPGKWLWPLPADDPLRAAADRLAQAAGEVAWSNARMRAGAGALGLRIMLARGYRSLAQIASADLQDAPTVRRQRGIDTLDAALCALGILERSPQRGATRQQRVERASVSELVARVQMPERFRAVTALYLETYAQRVSDTHTSLRNKATNLARFWRFIAERYPELGGCSELLPAHARAYVPAAIEQSRAAPRNPGDELRVTAYTWLSDVRVFLTDLCGWAAEPGSPLAPFAPRTLPLTHHDLKGFGFEKARRRQQARMTATVLELERAVPNIRAHAFTAWHEADQRFRTEPEDRAVDRRERDAFWDWAVLELLVQSGVRIEEACELTTLDVLKRQLPDGRLYYLLHVKPSKFDRARVIPIGDGLGRVIADIIARVRRFYGTAQIPPCDNWDHHERRPLPRAPYLLQGAGHPSVINANQVRARLARLSHGAGARQADGTPLVLRPHDCRRIFASEHLNNDTPPHVIQALLGHAAIDTVMVYAKLYPTKLVEEYRKATRGTYAALHGQGTLRTPTTEEWHSFAQSCSLRDMGTHVCALPAGDHCARGLVCLGCTHAQPKKSATPIFRRMLISHRRALTEGRRHGEPHGQLAARELEITRIESALRHAEELPNDVAAAIEGAAA